MSKSPLVGRLLLSLSALTALAALAHAQADWPTTRWTVFCEVGRDRMDQCAVLAPDLAGTDDALTEHLGAFSTWLEAEGFVAPQHLRAEGGTYEAVLVTPYARSGPYATDCASGETDCTVRLDPERYRSGTDAGRDPEPLKAVLSSVVASYPWAPSEATAWAWKGAAGGVLGVWKERHGLDWRPPTRHHDLPLHQPPAEQAAGTAAFWFVLGTWLSDDEPSARPLAEFFDAAAMADPLAELDAFLAPRGGLHAFFPFFTQLTRPVHFRDVPEVEIALPPGQDEERVELEGAVRRVAANAYRVRATASPDADTEVEIREPSAAADLHLVVDGGLYDAENRFTATIPKGETREFFVRLANVAHDAAQTTDDRRYTLGVTLRPVEPAYAVLRQDRPAELEPGHRSFGRLVVEGTPLDGKPEKLALHFEVRDAGRCGTTTG